MSVSSWKVSLCSLLTGLHQLFRAMLCWQTVLYCLQSKLLWAHKVQESFLLSNSSCTKTVKVLKCILETTCLWLSWCRFLFSKNCAHFPFWVERSVDKTLETEAEPSFRRSWCLILFSSSIWRCEVQEAQALLSPSCLFQTKTGSDSYATGLYMMCHDFLHCLPVPSILWCGFTAQRD